MAIASPVRRRQHAAPALDLRGAHQLHCLELESANRQPNTIHWHHVVIDRYETWARAELGIPEDQPVPLSALNTDNARGFIMWLRHDLDSRNPLTGKRRTVGDKTVQEHVRALKALASYLVSEGHTSYHVLSNLRTPKAPIRVPMPFSEQDVARIVASIEHRPLRSRNLALFFLLLASGCRIGEVLGLQVSDLDLAAGRAKVMGKGKRERVAYYDAATAKLLARYVRDRGPSRETALFLTKDGRPLKTNAVDLLFKSWGEEAGLTECHPHMTRHTFASVFLRLHPGQILQLQDLLGHSSLDMTRRYARHVATEAPLDGPSIVEKLGLHRTARLYR